MLDNNAIKKWMRDNVSNYADNCNEVNLTLMVEDWDYLCATGESTLNPGHPAWTIAAIVINEYKGKKG